MEQLLLDFAQYCKKPGVNSNKASSYAKAIQYLCDYLDISTINEHTVVKFKSIEDDLNNKNSGFYIGLLRFLEKRHQKSYLENGFIRAALRPFYSFIADSAVSKHPTGYFDSWEIIDEVTAIKHCDKSFFEHNCSGVPKGICWFFDAEKMNSGATKNINLLFNGVQYQCRVKYETSDHGRVRISWNVELGSLFNQYKSNDTTATFVRTEKDTFTISIRKEAQQKKSWLLAWNPNMWNWEDLSEAAELTQNGDSYPTTWACTSSGVAPGDRVYIITLGTNNNGIMASGYATSTQYEYEHWDPDKRADGQMNKGIDISLDHVIDVSHQNPLTQVFLRNQFPNQHWSPQGSGISIKDYYAEALEKAWIAFLDANKGGETEMTIKEKVDAIKAYIAARGFNYEGDLIENFYLSLKSKPFVILAGTSGTGKTRLVKLFAEAIGAQMKLVPVRPDWSDSSDLFGHTDLSGNFHPGAIIDFIKRAEWNKDTPHFLCLDEMNLARVEYYLSDFLSIIETRDRKANGAIETDALIDASYFQSQAAKEKYGRVYLPDNLYIIGTVNMDETTFPFSKKVLDRANTIEFSFVNLMARAAANGSAAAQKLDNSFLRTDYLYLQDCDDENLVDGVCFNLEEMNQILVKANLHVGYRVRDEVCFYMMNNKKTDLLPDDAAFDHEIMQKILPRIQGSSAAIKEVLSELFIKCAGDYSGFAGATAYEQMGSFLDSKPCKYPNSAKKIAFMMRRYEEDGFTSYWL